MPRSLLGKAPCILRSGSYVDLILFLALILAPQLNFVTYRRYGSLSGCSSPKKSLVDVDLAATNKCHHILPAKSVCFPANDGSALTLVIVLMAQKYSSVETKSENCAWKPSASKPAQAWNAHVARIYNANVLSNTTSGCFPIVQFARCGSDCR